MIALDDRTGNVLTTIALFATVAAVAYAARTMLVVFVLSLFFAYLLEPSVGGAQRLFTRRPISRAHAIAFVYAGAAVLLGAAAYAIAPVAADQMRRLRAAGPDLLARVTDRGFLAQHGDLITQYAGRAAHAAGSVAADIGWLFLVPIIAVFFLGNRMALIDGAIALLSHRRDRADVKRTIESIDIVLAQYVRGQLALAGLSVVFYSLSMALLGFPYPLALGIIGGALEFLPVVGWMLAAALMLASGWAAGAPWLPMAALIVIWRVVQSFVNSPRIMGNRLELEPLTVILALTAGGQIGGLLGVVLSVPIVAVLRILWLEHASREKAAAA